MQKRILVAAYIRVSSDKQRESCTIENQRRDLIPWCASQGYDIYDWYEDDGVSSEIPFSQRDGGRRLMQDAAEKKFELIVIWSLSRFERDLENALKTARELNQEFNLGLKSRNELIDTSTVMGEFTFQLYCSINQLEKGIIAERTRSGRARCAGEGRWMGGVAPYGYQVVDHSLVIHEAHAEVVQLIYQLYLQGRGPWAIATELNTRRIMAPRGDKFTWQEGTIKRILATKAYCGTYQYGKHEIQRIDGKPKQSRRKDATAIIETSCPAIVSELDWQAVQVRRDETKSDYTGKSQRDYFLRGMVTCDCGRNYCGRLRKNHNGWEAPYYSCKSNWSRSACGSPSVRADDLEAFVWDEVVAFLNDPKGVMEELAQRFAEMDSERSNLTTRRDELTAEIKVLEKQANVAADQIIRESNPRIRTRLEAALERMEQEIDSLKKSRDMLDNQVDLTEEWDRHQKQVPKLLEELRARIGVMSQETKREVVRRLVAEVSLTSQPGSGSRRQPVAEIRFKFVPDTSLPRRDFLGQGSDTTKLHAQACDSHVSLSRRHAFSVKRRSNRGHLRVISHETDNV